MTRVLFLAAVMLAQPGEDCKRWASPDIDQDGDVDPQDLTMLLGNWGPCMACACCVGDLNVDHVVDSRDLQELIKWWSPRYSPKSYRWCR